MKLGAVRYLDTDAADVAKELMSLGGASVILATAPDSKAMSALSRFRVVLTMKD
jgi:hypothetical protein